MDLKEIKVLYGKAREELELFRPLMNEVYTYVIPNKNNWRGRIPIPGERTDIQIFNDYPRLAINQWAAQLTSISIPAGTKFFNIKSTTRLDGADASQFDAQTEKIGDIILEKINDSNFYQAIIESFVDLGAGTAGLTINYDDERDSLYFTSLDMSMVSFLEDHTGQINYIFRRFELTDVQSQKLMFPKINFGCDRINILEVVYPISSKDEAGNSINKFMYMITDDEFSKVYFQQVSDTNPIIIFRWMKRPGENRGRGILTDLIGTIKTTNQMAQDLLNASALALSPPMITDNGALLNPNNVRIQPNAMITLNPNTRFEPFPVNVNLPFGDQAVAQKNALIAQALYIDILGKVGTAELTATEVNARLQLASNILGAFYNRLQREMLAPFILRVIDLLEKKGKIEPITIDTKTGNKRKLKLVFSSPIIDAEKSIEAQRLLQSIQFVMAATGDPRYVASGYKLEEFPYYSAKAFGARMDLVNDIDKTKSNLKGIIDAKQQMMQQNPSLQIPINTNPNVFQGA